MCTARFSETWYASRECLEIRAETVIRFSYAFTITPLLQQPIHNVMIINSITMIAIATFTTTRNSGDFYLFRSLSCYGYDPSGNISQCSYQLYTVNSVCNERYVAGLHCEGTQVHV